jgi:hypothetical protein
MVNFEQKTILEYFEVTPEYLTEVVFDNPSLRGMILGYLAERKLKDVFENDPRATATRKDDDHDRKKKGDLVVTYRGFEFKFESKALQTNHVEIFESDTESWIRKVIKKDGRWIPNPAYQEVWQKDPMNSEYRGKAQCDASDRRVIELPNGEEISTTCLLVGEFDILAAGLFAFREKWDFAFALNRDLPRSSYRKYSAEARNHLLASLVPLTWPIGSPFVTDPFCLLDQLIEERQQKKS